MTESKTRDRKPKLDVDVSPFAVAEDLVKDLYMNRENGNIEYKEKIMTNE